MPDTDSLTLTEASDAVLRIDLRYRTLLNIDDKEDLKPTRDQVFAAYTSARLKLLEEGVMTTQADVDEMEALRGEIEQAAEKQALIRGGVRVAGFLGRLAVRI